MGRYEVRKAIGRKATRTHLVALNADGKVIRALCGSVKAENLGSEALEEGPSCPNCKGQDPRRPNRRTKD